jgi:uncharacterized protein (TIGR02145 family)
LPALAFSQQRIGLLQVLDKTQTFKLSMPKYSLIQEVDSALIYQLTATFTNTTTTMADVFASGNYKVVGKVSATINDSTIVKAGYGAKVDSSGNTYTVRADTSVLDNYRKWFLKNDTLNVAYNVINLGWLYNWYAASSTDTIANTGWKVATSSDYEKLSEYLGNNGVAGGKLKETGTTYWTSPNIGATNEARFNARAAFRHYPSGSFIAGLTTFLWNRDQYAVGYGKASTLVNSSTFFTTTDIIAPYENSSTIVGESATAGGSIRLVKYNTSLTHGQQGTYTGNDGKIYRTICIGTQEWLADNLAETKYRSGTTIPIVQDNTAWLALSTGARCAFNNDISTVGGVDLNIITVNSSDTIKLVAGTNMNIQANGKIITFNADSSSVATIIGLIDSLLLYLKKTDAASTYATRATTVNTSLPLSGGGDLSANRTISLPAATTTENGYLPTATSNIIAMDSAKWVYINRMGFVDNTQSAIGFRASDSTFTLYKTGSILQYLRIGKLCTIPATQSLKITYVAGRKSAFYFYIDDNVGTLEVSTQAWTLKDTKVSVAIVEWDFYAHPDTTIRKNYLLLDERHTDAMDRKVNYYLHTTIGTRYQLGGQISGEQILPATASSANNQFKIAEAEIDDEDVSHILPVKGKPVTASHAWTLYHRTAANTWVWDTLAVPYTYTAGAPGSPNYISYENPTTGAAVTSQNSRYVNSYLLFTTAKDSARFIIVPGRAEFTSATLAQAEDPKLFTWTGFNLPEAVIMYRLTWQTSSGWTSALGRVKLSSITTISQSIASTAIPFPAESDPIYVADSLALKDSIDALRIRLSVKQDSINDPLMFSGGSTIQRRNTPFVISNIGVGGLRITTNIAGVGAGLTARDVAAQSIIQLGNNYQAGYTGPIDQTKAGVMIRLDTRNGIGGTAYGGNSYTLFQILARVANTTISLVPFQICAAPTGSFIMQESGYIGLGILPDSNLTIYHGLNVIRGLRIGKKIMAPGLIAGTAENSLITWNSGTGEFIPATYYQNSITTSNTISGDFTWSNLIPAGYMLEYVIIKNTSVTDTISLDLGTSAGTGNVFLGTLLPANSFTTISIGKVFSLTGATSLYLNDDAWGGSYWKGATINAKIVYRKID